MPQKCVNAGIDATKCTAFGNCMQAAFAATTQSPAGTPRLTKQQRQAMKQQQKVTCQQTAGFTATDIANFPSRRSGQSGNNNGNGKGAMTQQKCVNAGIDATKCTAFDNCMQAAFAARTQSPAGSPKLTKQQRQALMQQQKTTCQQTAGFTAADIANIPTQYSRKG
jgi:hydroxymethylglutaryl-CoA reductase